MNEHGADPSVSVIGLGAMGAAIARTFIAAGYRVSVWNRSYEKVQALTTLGAIACSSPREAIECNVHTVVCLTDYPVWKGLITQHRLQEILSGKSIIQLTGGTFAQVQEHASFIETQGGRIADGALMCFPPQLGTEKASLLVAGASDVLDECAPLLRTLAPTWTNLGDDITRPAVLSRALTSGIVTALLGFLNGAAMCRAGGIPLDTFMAHAVKAESIVPPEKRRLLEAIRDGDTKVTEASIQTWAGAHETIHSVADALGTNLVLQDAVRAVLQEAQRMGLGAHDLAAVVEVFRGNA
jgi:3-hydroxyisobutyrate dehydrogenase-like beta-hydroxyacid dehydrogenase